ncbi:hypothetical protein HD806DRAFT_191308 [Xylariaceae sp. AK1471]|nr:hypothetical protein HD806DRAFT_191308 [Xylariaceae sp. AK1471]
MKDQHRTKSRWVAHPTRQFSFVHTHPSSICMSWPRGPGRPGILPSSAATIRDELLKYLAHCRINEKRRRAAEIFELLCKIAKRNSKTNASENSHL